ncbi:MAG: hypothetical protein ACLP59_15740 [Bryobacteraceae bacterium]
MSTIKQIRANRRNAQRSTGPKTQAGKDRVRFNSLVHGFFAESAILPGESQEKFDAQLARVTGSWNPQDDFEKDLVEQIANCQWKLARLDRAEAVLYAPDLPADKFAASVHRVYLTQSRLRRDISRLIADLEHYRKQRVQRQAEQTKEKESSMKPGLIWNHGNGVRHYTVLPRVKGLDGEWREIPREILGDFDLPDPPPAPPDPQPTTTHNP